MMISLVVISLVVSAYTPVITKKARASLGVTHGSFIGGGGGISGGSSLSASDLANLSADCSMFSDKCTMCVPSSKCVLCLSGYYVNAEGNCSKCSEDFENSISCTLDGPTECNSTYYPDATTKSCVLCPEGSYCSNGRSKVACAPGTASNTKGRIEACDSCAVGTYANQEGLTECKSCGEHKTTYSIGSTSASDCVCVAGYGTENCSAPCPIGQYSTLGTTCTSCGTNKTTLNTASTSPSACVCAAGYGTENCANPCPVGQYSIAGGTCTGCGENKTTLNTGSISVSSCICVAGYGSDGCTNPCPIGQYSSIGGTCTACGTNQTTLEAGSTSASACVCAAGYGTENCADPCPIAQYSIAGGTCTSCGTNMTTDQTGTTSYSDCKPLGCSPGYYLSGGECKSCPAGSKCAGGTANKVACTGSTYQPYGGRSNCFDCNGNEYHETWNCYETNKNYLTCHHMIYKNQVNAAHTSCDATFVRKQDVSGHCKH